MNVVLLVVDALRYDRCGFAGYERDTTPFLDKFAEQNTVFHEAYSPSTHTRESVAGILTGKPPFESVNDDYELKAETIAEELKEQGYSTSAFHSNVFLSKPYGYAKGFDEFYDGLQFSGFKIGALAEQFVEKTTGKKVYTRADDINEMAEKWWRKTGGDKFMWIQYMDVHGPYEPEENYQIWAEWDDREKVRKLYKRAANGDPEDISEEEAEYMSDLYDCEIRYMDQKIKQLVEFLENQDEENSEETMIIITSDHGEAFGEHGYYDHPRKLDPVLTHVPLLINTGNDEVDQPVTLLDTYTTATTQENSYGQTDPTVQARSEDGKERRKSSI
ncbi:MAG: sulfatase [Candidatus Nanohaloarchaea archaeon]